MRKRLNLGCGLTPTPGWENYDNSPGVFLANHPGLAWLLEKLKLLSRHQKETTVRRRELRIPVRRANVAKRIPVENGCAEVVYASHLLEHLDAHEVARFLQEVRRILAPGGVIRLVVPDLQRMVARYVQDGDANALVAGTLLAQPRPRGLAARLQFLLLGPRAHLWMYDGPSLSRLLLKHGFEQPVVLAPGETTIADSGDLNLREREADSLYLEARRP